MGVDFFLIIGYKFYGLLGLGVIYVKKECMVEMCFFLGGGDMICDVIKDIVIYNDDLMWFEVGIFGIV